MGFWVFFTDDKLEYYDSDDCALYLSSDHVVEIVCNDKTIFDFLISHRNQPMTRLQIQSQIYGWVDIGDGSNKDADRNPIDQAIAKLRRTLDKYRWCIKTVRGQGYKYIGPEKVNKDTADATSNKERAQDDSDGGAATKVVSVEKETVVSVLNEDRDSTSTISNTLDFSNAKDFAYTRKIERAKRVIEELTYAFEALVVAQSGNDVEIARVKIINSIRQCPTYAYFILELLEDGNNDDVVLSLPWDEASTKLKAQLIGMIDHYERTLERNLAEGLGNNPELESIKIDLLLGFREGWHIMVSFLEETLRREQENLRLAESQLQKEFVQNLIKKTELKLDLARDRAIEEDRTFDTAMISYRQTSSIDKPIV